MPHNRSFRFPAAALLSLTLGLTGLLIAGSAEAAPRIRSIASARELPLGTIVTVAGLVSTPSGAFNSSLFDQGFGIQDQTAGIFVSLQQDLHVLPRRQVIVTGKLEDHTGLLTIVPASTADVDFGGIGAKITPVWLQSGAVGEETEGLIVEVVGRITQAPTSDLPYGYKLSVDDGSGEVLIFVNVETGIDVASLELGELVRVAGFSSQYDTHYEIDPRRPSDIGKPAL